MNETAIVRAIIDAVNASGIALVWRQNTGAAKATYGGRTRFIRFGVVGAADITGYIRGSGRRLEIEVKRPGGKTTASQDYYGRAINEGGALYFVAHSVEEAITRLKKEVE